MAIKLVSVDFILVAGLLCAAAGLARAIIPILLGISMIEEPLRFATWAGGLVVALYAISKVVVGTWSPTQHHRTITSTGFADCELATTKLDSSWGNHPEDAVNAAPHAAKLLRPRKLTSSYPPPFPNGWFLLTASQDLPVSTSRYFSALGLHIALFRDSKGKVHALDAYCPHLGANLAVGECFVCAASVLAAVPFARIAPFL